MSHSPEPWVVEPCETSGFGIHSASFGVAHVFSSKDVCPRDPEEARANADRIVACVNACRGIPTDQLDGITSMLTRRTFLTTIAAAPLAQFCKTEPARPYVFRRNVISIAEAERKFNLKPGTLRPGKTDISYVETIAITLTCTGTTLADVERRIALTQGTLG